MLEKCHFLKYQRLALTPAMCDHHKERHIACATEIITWSHKTWSTVVWSDENRLTLDGPDVLAYEWQDLRAEKQWFSKRQNGGGSVMVWACLAGTRLSELVIVEGKQDGLKYIKTLENHSLPFGEDLPLIWMFMQDGAPCHRAKLVKIWLKSQHVTVIEWPAYSPDLNPIANLLEILVRHVYANQRQIMDVDSLIVVIFNAWESIEPQVLDNLVKLMQKRCIEVVM